MAALTATDWVIVIQDRWIGDGGKRHSRCSLTLPTAGSYPSNGIPWPGSNAVGMKQRLDYVILLDANPNANTRTLNDADNSSFRVFSSTASATQEAETATTVTLGSSATPFVLYAEFVGA
jgi:hypothetical protein